LSFRPGIRGVYGKHPPNTAAVGWLRRGGDRDHLLPVVPGQQLGQSGCWVIGNPCEHIGQPGAQRALGGIVGQANAAVVEESGELLPALEHIARRLGELDRRTIG
jgi:hypothetical protein